MLVILKMRGNPGEPLVDMGDMPKIAPEIAGWIIASDVHDARRQAESIGDNDLAAYLYSSTEFPRPGRHELLVQGFSMARYVMLVD
jgi:hypothetical protein